MRRDIDQQDGVAIGTEPRVLGDRQEFVSDVIHRADVLQYSLNFTVHAHRAWERVNAVVPFKHHNMVALLTEQCCEYLADGAVADDGNVIDIRGGHVRPTE